MAGIPEKLINFRIYDSLRKEMLGVADVDLPDFESMTETVSGAGIAGEYDAPTLGHFSSMELGINWRSVTGDLIGFLKPTQHSIGLYGAIQVQNPALGTVIPTPLRVEVIGMQKGGGLGSMTPGSPMESSTTIEILSISIFIDNLPRLILDKINSVYIVDGVDYLAAVRVATGGV